MIWFMIACIGNETEVKQLYPDLAVSLEFLDFGEVKVDEEKIETIQLINAGQSKLYIESITLSGDGAEAFAVTPTEGEVDRNERIDVNVSFTPSSLTDFVANLTINSNDEEFPEYNVSVTGAGGLGPLPNIELDNSELDFGDVFPGNDSLLFFNIINAGDADLDIYSTTQTGSGYFSLITDVDGQTLAAGASTSILVNYAPIQTVGDSGSLTISSNDPDEPSLVVDFIGNGGGDFIYPEAILGCPSNVTLPDSVNINGANSIPSDETLIYEWSLSNPTGSTTELNPNTLNNAVALDIDVAGTYTVGLVVTNEAGVPSPSAECIIEAIPPSDVYAELSWNDPLADLDLHMLLDPEGIFQYDADCCWCNSSPPVPGNGSWNESSDSNPVLLQDSQDGAVSEIIDLLVAPDGEYYLRVHYFSDSGAGISDATIRIYIEGVLTGQYTQPMNHNQVWDVGFVRWPSKVLAEELEEPYALTTNRSCQ